MHYIAFKALTLVRLIADVVSGEGNAIGRVRPSVRVYSLLNQLRV